MSKPKKRICDSNPDTGQQILETKTTEFSLSNGLHFIVLERHTVPIVSCHTFANVGAFEEPTGKTGIAHMLEHEAFKGSSRIGTQDWRREKPLLSAQDSGDQSTLIDDFFGVQNVCLANYSNLQQTCILLPRDKSSNIVVAFYGLKEAQQNGNRQEADRLQRELMRLQQQASELSISNDFGARLTQAGAVGLNASTSHDATRYVASLPSNVLELWFALEAERFQYPVFRELYSEKRVVLEERRARVDNSPLGKFQEAFNGHLFSNNYRRPVIGYQADIEGLGRREVQEFFQAHYVPKNITIAIVGDTSPDQVYKFAARYFGEWRPGSWTAPDEHDSQDLPDHGSRLRHFEQASLAGPALMKAFYRGPTSSPDAIILDVISDVLSGSRTSRLERNLVQSGKAFATSFLPAIPGDKYACASLLYVIPTKPTSLDEAEQSLMQELSALTNDGLNKAELKRIKKAAKLELVEAIRFNSSMAASLCSYHALTGSWKTVFSDLARIDALTSLEVQETANRIFRESNSFTGLVLPVTGQKSVHQKPEQRI